MALDYLTVQDVLWVNLKLTKRVVRFNYARLEEATFYQYAYGASSDLQAQAARFLSGFLKMAPFEAGNEGTAFISCIAFLRINHVHVRLTDEQALQWFEDVRDGKRTASEAIRNIVEPDEHGHHEDTHGQIRSVVADILGQYAGTVARLSVEPALA